MVDTNDVKKYLKQIEYLDFDINSRQREMDTLNANSFIKAAVMKEDKVQETEKGAYDDKYIRYMERKEEYRNEINNEIDKLVDLKRTIRYQINQLDDRMEMIVLRDKYINRITWEKMAESLNQSVRNIHNIHSRALISFGKQYEKEINRSIK